MRGSPPPTDEQSALRSIAALIKNHEPQFDLQTSFTPGVLGCADPQYPMVRREWLDALNRKGLTSNRPPSVLESIIDDVGAGELGWQKYQPADSRFNWRVTVHHGDRFIHIMALDKNFERFAFSLQSEGNLEAGLTSDWPPRPDCLRYKVVNRLSELKPILDDLYKSFEERRQQDRINKAVAEEREKWEERLANEREKRQQFVYVVMYIMVVIAVLFVIGKINKHFHGVPGDVILTVLGAGIGAFIGALFYLLCLVSVGLKFGFLKDGEAAPLLRPSAWIVFFVLWAALLALS